MKVIGLDVGEKRIGVARADSDTRIAVPVGFIVADGSEWQEIARIARLNNTNLFVVGMPRSNEGNETAQSLYARNFAKTLVEKMPGARVRFQDESLTSVEAEERLKKHKKRYDRGEIDAEAASIILQDFLEGLSAKATFQKSSSEDRKLGRAPLSVSEEEGLEMSQTVRNLAKKEGDKVKLKTKKAKHKMKGWVKSLIILIIAAGIAGVATWGVNWFIQREEQKRAYAEYIAEQEAKLAKSFNFTVRPGETLMDVKNNLLKVDRNGDNEEGETIANYTEAEIDEAFHANYDFAFLQGRPEGATLEGYLYPETYNFYGTATVKEIMEKFLTKMGEVIRENDLESKYAAHGLNLFEGVTLASVVQKEASSPEQPTVAQVFLSRLSYGIPLGSDVTVSYALDTVDPGRHTYADNEKALKVDSCYNTRVYAGLPCGPISNPGISALLAVANPTDTAYLYFLTGDDGLMYYSYTEAEHIRNIYNHCGNLCNVSL